MREDQVDPGALPARRSGRRSTSSRPARGGWATPSAASSSSGATAGGSTARRAPRRPRHQRLVAQRRLRRGLRRGREQHERGVVGHHAPRARPTPAASSSSTRAPPTTRCSDAFRLAALRARAPTSPPSAAHFDAIEPAGRRRSQARGDQASLAPPSLERVRLTGMRLEFETFSTGGDEHQHARHAGRRSRRAAVVPGLRPACESFYADVEAQPATQRHRHAVAQRAGNVPGNPIDEIFYENRGRARIAVTADGETVAARTASSA